MTSDGRDFSVLTEKEVDGLADAEYDRYQKWKIAQKQKAVVSLDASISQKQKAVVSLDVSISQKKSVANQEKEIITAEWAKIQPMLSILPENKVRAYLERDPR